MTVCTAASIGIDYSRSTAHHRWWFVSVAWGRVGGDTTHSRIIKGFATKRAAQEVADIIEQIGRDSWPKGESHEG